MHPAYQIAPVPRPQARAYIEAHHYLRTAPRAPTVALGLWQGATLIGVALIGVSCSEAARAFPFGPAYKTHVLELTRFHVLDGTPRNTESWFLARVRRRLDRRLWGLLAFADPSAGHVGTLYQASSALYLGQTRARRAYRDSAGRTHSERQGRTTFSAATATAYGWTAVPQPPKHRYLFLLGGPLQRHYVRQALRVPVLPYPAPLATPGRWSDLVTTLTAAVAAWDHRYAGGRLARHYYHRLGWSPPLPAVPAPVAPRARPCLRWLGTAALSLRPWTPAGRRTPCT